MKPRYKAVTFPAIQRLSLGAIALQQSGGCPKVLQARAALMARILVVDDNDLVRRGMRQLLQQHEGWEVCGEAANGQDAITKARELAPDVVVLDFAMPTMNGIEAARQIHEEHPNTMILLCSMYLDRQLAKMAQGVGVTSVLSKSNVGQVVKSVEAGLRGESFHKTNI